VTIEIIQIIAVQEHWLHDSNLQLLNNIHPDFVGFSISAMSERLRTSVYCGQPYGGVGFLWRKTISSSVIIGTTATSGRCLSLALSLDCSMVVNIATVYFPCYSTSISYSIDLSECLSFLEEMLDDGLPAVILGDMNFSCDLSNDGYRQCYSALSRYNVFNCDECIDDGVGTCVTYCNQGLQQSSFLDHVFVSNSIRHHINGAEIHDTGVNLSDHIPIIYSFNWSITLQACQTNRPKKIKLYSWWWDKSDLNYYYQCKDQELRAISIPRFCNCCDLNCKLSCHLDAINIYYENIVAALHCAASIAVRKVPCLSLKPLWNEELDRLKQDSVFWHNMWVDAGRPSSGVLQHIRLSCKTKYKLAISNAYS